MEFTAFNIVFFFCTANSHRSQPRFQQLVNCCRNRETLRSCDFSKYLISAVFVLEKKKKKVNQENKSGANLTFSKD